MTETKSPSTADTSAEIAERLNRILLVVRNDEERLKRIRETRRLKRRLRLLKATSAVR
jgi:hypothetical protein